GAWGNALQIGINKSGSTFTLVVREVSPATSPTAVVGAEVFRNLSMDATSPQFVDTVVKSQSSLITTTATGSTPPDQTSASDVTAASAVNDPASALYTSLGTSGVDGVDPTGSDAATFAAAMDENALLPIAQVAPYKVNLLCLPVAATFT